MCALPELALLQPPWQIAAAAETSLLKTSASGPHRAGLLGLGGVGRAAADAAAAVECCRGVKFLPNFEKIFGERNFDFGKRK